MKVPKLSFLARFAGGGSARSLLFHERDLTEMELTDVIAAFLVLTEFVSARRRFASFSSTIAEMIIPFAKDFPQNIPSPLVIMTFL